MALEGPSGLMKNGWPGATASAMYKNSERFLKLMDCCSELGLVLGDASDVVLVGTVKVLMG